MAIAHLSTFMNDDGKETHFCAFVTVNAIAGGGGRGGGRGGGGGGGGGRG